MNIFGRHKNSQEEAKVQKSTEYMKKLLVGIYAENKNRGIGSTLETLIEFFINNGLWVEKDGLGDFMAVGKESVVYKSRYENVVYKVKHSNGFILTILGAIYHNILFPHTFYSFAGFTSYKDRIAVVLKQKFVNGTHATYPQIERYLKSNGFDYYYMSGCIMAWKRGVNGIRCADICPKNAIFADGKTYLIDASFEFKDLNFTTMF